MHISVAQNYPHRFVTRTVMSFILICSSCAMSDEERESLLSLATEVSTLAGSETPGMVDGIGSLAKFNHPSGIALVELKVARNDLPSGRF